MLAAKWMATMRRTRLEANLPIGTGVHALQLVSEAAADLVRARRKPVEAHAALADVRDAIGLRDILGYGDVVPYPPSVLEETTDIGPRRLAVVA